MKKFLGLRTHGYKVNDIQAAKAWYTQALGVEPYFDEPFYVGFNVGGYEFGLQTSDETLTPGTNSFTYWGVEDMEKSYRELLDLGATEYEKPMDVGEGILVATVRDPWNNIFGLIYNPYFKLD